MRRYGESKLLLTAWAMELATRVEGEASVYTMCPGPVATGIAREAPRWSQPLIDPVIRTFFAAPEVGAKPIVYLACARELEGKTGLYHHRWEEKAASDLALDRDYRAVLWDASQRILEQRSTR